ncbi:M23 family metallopeptidase [Alcanivorax sp. 1008]|uniref:M23 family metallopeptidase n=1 Tax=Alcanivorax sp. 1008 TaxID=2816853 RepID=UPI001E418410|nr:M23 family metallopeptidase [Alcanivorax sp. 1008]
MSMTRLLIASFLLSCSTLLLAQPLLSLRGEPAPGALMIGQVEPGSKVWLDERPLRVNASGYFLFGFGRDAEGESLLRIEGDAGRQESLITLKARDWNIQRVEGVPARTVTPPPEALERIRTEAALVRAARQTDSDLAEFSGQFVWPASGRISGVYGSQRVYNGNPGNPHYGVDIAAPTGSPVVAPAGGVVTLVHPEMFYSGGTLLLDHGMGLSSTFIHLNKVLVEEGQVVRQGDLIAEIGASGRATGPHLDWRLNWYQERLDPQWFMGGMQDTEVSAGAPMIGRP